MFEFDERRNALDKTLFSDQMSDLGYQTHNSILNLKSLFYLLVIYFVRVFLLFIMALIVKLTKRSSRFYEREKK